MREKGKFMLVLIHMAIVNDCRQIFFLKSSKKVSYNLSQ